MKRWQIILVSTLSLLVLALSPLAVMAAGPEASTAATPNWKGALAIVAPRIVAVGKEMSLRVFEREHQDPVEGAGVWAVPADKAQALKQDLSALREKGANAAVDSDIEARIGGHGGFLGRTGNDGRLTATFKEAGGYILVAFKPGYFPDFSPLKVGGINRKALAVEAPKRAEIGENVTIRVTEKAGGDAVKDAGVWAVTKENIEPLKAKLAEIRQAKPADIEDYDWDAAIRPHAIFLGTTNGNGQLKHEFKDGGVYLLVAVKRGYIPGYAGIAIGSAKKALGVTTPGRVQVNEPAKLSVFERGTQDPVKDAGLWAVTRENIEALKAKLAEAREANKANLEAVDWDAIIQAHAFFLGNTNGSGDLKYTFTKEGGYLIVAVKKGYIPGYGTLAVIAPKPVPQRPNTQSLRPNQANQLPNGNTKT